MVGWFAETQRQQTAINDMDAIRLHAKKVEEAARKMEDEKEKGKKLKVAERLMKGS